MSKQPDSNLFISAPLTKYAELYQGLLRGIGSFQQLGSRLVSLGETAHAFRRFHLVREVGQMLSRFPIRDFQTVGHYFLAVASNSCGKGDQCEARKLFELVVDTASSKYKAKAILSLAGVSANTGDYDAELYYFTEALKASSDICTTVTSYRGIAVHKAREGHHTHAIRDLENLAPLIKYAPASAYFDYLNSYAVELVTADRLIEAREVSNLVLASPLAIAYPEWQETLADVRSRQRRRSAVTITRPEIVQEYKIESEVPENPLDEARTQTAIDFMGANLHRSITLPELSELVNLSPSHFSSVFKTQTGVSPIGYLIRLRMEKASHLLATTFLSIKQVMATVGYLDRQTFLQHFRRRFDLTPSAYRKRALSRLRRY